MHTAMTPSCCRKTQLTAKLGRLYRGELRSTRSDMSKREAAMKRRGESVAAADARHQAYRALDKLWRWTSYTAT